MDREHHGIGLAVCQTGPSAIRLSLEFTGGSAGTVLPQCHLPLSQSLLHSSCKDQKTRDPGGFLEPQQVTYERDLIGRLKQKLLQCCQNIFWHHPRTRTNRSNRTLVSWVPDRVPWCLLSNSSDGDTAGTLRHCVPVLHDEQTCVLRRRRA